MNAADIQTRTPTVDGRYLTFVRCAAVQAQDWVEPTILVWVNGRWHTSFLSQNNILGWIGPIPAMKVEDIRSTKQEFDL